MMSTPKQPRKKRRLDSQESKEVDVPPEVLPLVSPNEVKKSSKDPNRGMYPKKITRPHGKRNLSCPSFSNASKLLKGSKTSEDSDVSLAEISIQEKGSPQPKTHKLNVSSEVPKAHCSTFNPGSKPKKKTAKSKFPVVNFANKILNYFRPAPNSKKTGNEEAYSSSDDFQEASTSKEPNIPKPEISTTLRISEISKPESSNSSSDEKVEAFFKTFRNCYGLLGEVEEDTRPNYFARLPCHVLETILCQIPYIDLIKYKQVCSTWNKVIRDPAFMEFKKIYYSLKANKLPVSFDMVQICKDYKDLAVENCFSVVIKYMSNNFGKTTPVLNMYDLLSKNQKAVEAELVLAERFPEVLKKESKAWSIFATAMLLSETVEDVYSLYRSVNKLSLETSLHDVTDAMYCIASFLLYFRDTLGINHGLHYRVYNAIYWIENSLPPKEIKGSQALRVPKGLPGQQSIHSYGDSSKSDLTYEQIRILNHCFQPDQIIKIVALAGTGKTTTLIHLAKLHPQVKFLNVMFNKAVCDDAKKRFPPNVTCRTAHSLAYAVYGNRLRSKLSIKIRPHDIVQHLKHNAGCRIQTYCFAKLVLATIDRYVGSVDPEIILEHVPSTVIDPQRVLTDIERHKILKDATQIWEKMIDTNNKNLRITHDTYLKLFQLSKPKFTEYQCIMVDEAQDCNPAMLDIVMSQKVPVIVVGDPNQQIYGFRGAKNAIQSLQATHTYHLTKSFRFGPEIAYIASCCLEVLNATTAQTIVGTNKPSTIDGKAEGQYAILARSNVQLFNEAIRLCCLGRSRNAEPTNIQGCFAGGIRGYGFDQMLDIYKLASHSDGSALDVSDKFISKFRSYRDLCNYAKSVDDNDLLAKIDLVNQHSMNMPDYIKTIKEKCSHSMELANVVFSTVHKAKGLEFDTVALTDDFIYIPIIEPRRQRVVDMEENNILYVALTRAKKCLLLPDKLMRILLLAQEKFEYPKLASNVLGSLTELECICCRDVFTPHTKLVMVRRRIVVANGRVIPGGPLCLKCGTEPTVRPRVTVEPVVMYLDPCADFAHQSMAALVGPLPSDPPIVRDSVAFNEMDVVYVINLHM